MNQRLDDLISADWGSHPVGNVCRVLCYYLANRRPGVIEYEQLKEVVPSVSTETLLRAVQYLMGERCGPLLGLFFWHQGEKREISPTRLKATQAALTGDALREFEEAVIVRFRLIRSIDKNDIAE